jgi:hypothetical protein
MTRILLLAFLSFIIVLNFLYCGGDTGQSTDSDSTETEISDQEELADEEEALPQLPIALCDMAPYQLLPREQVGQLVSWEFLLLDFTPRALDRILEQAGYTALSPVPFGAKVFRYRYTTQDRGELVEATATIAVPANAELPSEKLSFVLSLHGTSGFSPPCAPSGREDGPAQAAMMAALGFIGVAPDYIGLTSYGEPSGKHGYLVGEQAAIGSWDALRAAEQLLAEEDFQLEFDDPIRWQQKVLIWGFSQGGHAAFFSELLGAYYAPEYEVPGVASIVPPTSLFSVAQSGMETFSGPTAFAVPMFVTMRHWYGSPENMRSILVNEEPLKIADNAEDWVYTLDECNAGEHLDSDDINQVEHIYTQETIDAVLAEQWHEIAPWNCYIREAGLTTSSVPPLRFTPTLIVWSELDDLAIPAKMRGDVGILCDQGYQIEHMECMGAGHAEGAVWALPEQLQWLRDRLDGKALNETRLCTLHEPVCCSGTTEPSVCVPAETER